MQHTIEIDHRDIRIDVYEPATDGTRHPAILLMHGAGGNVENWLARSAPMLNEAGLALFAPRYFDSTGTRYADLETINDGFHVPRWLAVLERSLAFVAAQPGVAPERIALAGISLGAFLSLAFAATQSNRAAGAPGIRCLLDLSGGLVEPYRTQATSDFPPTLIVHGEADTVVPVSFALDLDRRLKDLTVQHELKLLAGEGHWFSSAAQWQLLLTVSSFLFRHLAP